MFKEEEDDTMMSNVLPNIEKPKPKRIIKRRTNKLSKMSKTDFKEANRISKSTRGISNITWNDLFKED